MELLVSANKYEILPYQPEHFFLLNYRHRQADLEIINKTEQEVAQIYFQSRAFSGFVNGELVAIVGILKLWERVGSAWARTSELVVKYPLFFQKNIRRRFELVVREMNLKRVQAEVLKEYTVSRLWIERLGFKEEGEMPFYMGDRTYIRYARIF